MIVPEELHRLLIEQFVIKHGRNPKGDDLLFDPEELEDFRKWFQDEWKEIGKAIGLPKKQIIGWYREMKKAETLEEFLEVVQDLLGPKPD